MSEFEREREELMDEEAPDLPFGRRPRADTRRNFGLWVVGILLALAIPLFYVAFGLAGALVATGALPVILVVAGLFFALVGLSGVYAYVRLRERYDRGTLYRDDVGNRVTGGETGGEVDEFVGESEPAAAPENRGRRSVAAVMKTDLVVCGTLDSIYDCAREMYEHNIGFLVVLNELDRCVGVVTDRDLVCAGIAQGVDMKATPVTTVMETQIRFVGPRGTVDDCLRLMRGEGIRRLPVMDGDKVIGVVTLDDLLAEERISAEEAAPVLRRQMQEPNAHHGLKPHAA